MYKHVCICITRNNAWSEFHWSAHCVYLDSICAHSLSDYDPVYEKRFDFKTWMYETNSTAEHINFFCKLKISLNKYLEM